MELTKIRLADGGEITSGQGSPAVVCLTLTRSVTNDQQLSVGAVCAAMAELELLTEGESPIHQDDTFTLYKGDRKLGIFTAQKPKWTTPYRVKITAYDPVAKLDRDLTQWLEEQPVLPQTLGELASDVCRACGVSWSERSFPNQDFPVKPFTGSNITGRRILGWIAQASGCFCTADADGVLQFDWYKKTDKGTIGPYRAEAQHYYYQNSLKPSDYETAPIEKVQIRQNSSDVGTVYPDIGEGNTYIVEGNPLLTAEDPEELLPVAEHLYHRLKDITYTPCSVTLAAFTGFSLGELVDVTDSGGKQRRICLMESVLSGNRETFQSQGTPNRSKTAASNYNVQALAGKILELQTDVNGLRAAHADTAGNAASLSMTLKGIETRVTAQTAELEQTKETVSALQQDSDGLRLQVQTITANGVERITTSTGYSFSEEGLRISRSGLEMENLLDHTGMQVKRNNQVILQADNRGVKARDVQVENYLILGLHARFEDYGDGTACFYI